MLDLLAQAAFFPACPAVLRQQVVEVVSMGVAVPSKFCKAVVDSVSITFQAEQFILAGMVDERRRGDLCQPVVLLNRNAGDLLFHAKIDR